MIERIREVRRREKSSVPFLRDDSEKGGPSIPVLRDGWGHDD